MPNAVFCISYHHCIILLYTSFMSSAHLTNISSVIQWHSLVKLRVVLILQLRQVRHREVKKLGRDHSEFPSWYSMPTCLNTVKVHTITETSLSLFFFNPEFNLMSCQNTKISLDRGKELINRNFGLD